MNLIVQAPLVEPPTEALYFRYVTLVAHENLHLDCLLEVEQMMKDIYYHWLLKQGCMDYIEDIVTPTEAIPGLRLGPLVEKAPAIRLKAIKSDSVIHLIGMIKGNVYGID
jgi:hypothetical protein